MADLQPARLNAGSQIVEVSKRNDFSLERSDF